MSDRKASFERAFADFDEKALTKCVDFAKHGYVSIERDALTMARYVKGHASLRAACDYLAHETEAGEPFIPEAVINLDSSERHELDMLAFVFPASVDAVGVVLPRQAAADAVSYLRRGVADNLADGRSVGAAITAIDTALRRRS